MNCENAKEMLELSFGDKTLSAELLADLQDCDACASYQAEMTTLAAELGDDDSIFSPAELERAALAVEAKINPAPVVKLNGWSWMQPMMRIAAVLALVAVSVVSYKVGQDSFGGNDVAITAANDYEYGSLSSLYVEDLDEALDDDVIAVLIDEYADDGSFGALGASDALVGEITEEEFEYLMDNFEVGDLL